VRRRGQPITRAGCRTFPGCLTRAGSGKSVSNTGSDSKGDRSSRSPDSEGDSYTRPGGMSLGIKVPGSNSLFKVTSTLLSYEAMVVATAGTVFSSSEQLTGAGQTLEIEINTGEKMTGGCSTRTHVQQPANPPLGRDSPDCTWTSLILQQVDVHTAVKQFLMIITEANIRRKRDMTTVSSASVPRILEEYISITRRQQRRSHKEDLWLETAVCPHSLPSTKTACEAQEEVLESEAEIHHLGRGAFPWRPR
jgi:hypothetical protein